MSDKIKVVGQKIKFFREQQGLSQKKFAEIIGIGSKTLFNYEQSGNITIEVLFKIAEYFNKNPIVFLSEDSAKYVGESDVSYKSQKDSEMELIKAELKFLRLKVETLEEKNREYEKEREIKEKELKELKEKLNGMEVHLVRLGVEDSIIVQIMDYVRKIKH